MIIVNENRKHFWEIKKRCKISLSFLASMAFFGGKNVMNSFRNLPIVILVKLNLVYKRVKMNKKYEVVTFPL